MQRAIFRRTKILRYAARLKQSGTTHVLPRAPESTTRSCTHPPYRPFAEFLEPRRLLSTGTWTPLANPAPTGIGTMLLLSNGTVMAQGAGVTNTWYSLTPDSDGNYVDGTWSQLASMSTDRLYFATNVLTDGRVFLMGGEYSGPSGKDNDNNTGEIYDPVANTWTPITTFPQSAFGDAPSSFCPMAAYLRDTSKEFKHISMILQLIHGLSRQPKRTVMPATKKPGSSCRTTAY